MTETTTSSPFTSSLILISKNEEIVLQPSKAGRRKENQFDLPSCSDHFKSPEACMNYFNKLIHVEKYPEKVFKKYFKIPKKLLTFSHSDDLGKKYLTGYFMFVEHRNMVHSFIESIDGIFLPKNDILEKNTNCFISNMYFEFIKTAFIEAKEFKDSFLN